MNEVAALIAADPDGDFGREIELVFKKEKEINVRGSTDSLSELSDLIAKHKPTVLLLGPGWEKETILSFSAGLKEQAPYLSVIWMVEEVDQELADRAKKARIQHLLQVPVELENLVLAIQKAHQSSLDLVRTTREAEKAENQADLKTVEVEVENGADDPAPSLQVKPEKEPESKSDDQKKTVIPGKPEVRLVGKLDFAKTDKHEKSAEAPAPSSPKIVTVFSTKGGVGKTVIAVNLAVCLAQKKGLKTILADFDLQSGDVGVMLKLPPKRTIYDCLAVVNELDGEALGEFLTGHASGLEALQAPVEPALADLINPAHIDQILRISRNRAEFVIVDTPPFFNDDVLATLDLSDLVLLVTTMDVPSVKNVKLCLETLKLLGYPAQKIKLAINRADADVGLHQSEVEKALGLKASLVLPNEPSVILSVNNGVPMVSSSPRSAISRAIRGFVEELVHAPVLNAEQKSLEREIV